MKLKNYVDLWPPPGNRGMGMGFSGGSGGAEEAKDQHANNSDTCEATKNAREALNSHAHLPYDHIYLIYIFVELFLYRLDIVDARFLGPCAPCRDFDVDTESDWLLTVVLVPLYEASWPHKSAKVHYQPLAGPYRSLNWFIPVSKSYSCPAMPMTKRFVWVRESFLTNS